MIYVLHFDHPLHHAQHYLGSTHNLRNRLIAHARGRGARLTHVIQHQGITWQLAALYQPQWENCDLSLRELERLAKRSHNTRRYCPICTTDYATPPYCHDFPIQSIPFPTTSEGLR